MKNNSRYFQIFLAHDTITNTKCNDKITVLVIQPNSTHHMCWKMRPNPTQRMDGPNPCPSLLYPRRSPHAFPYPLFTLSFCHLHYRSFILEAQKCSKESCKIDQRTTTKLDREKAVCTCSTSPKSRIFFIMFKSISRRCQILNATFPPFPSCVLFTAFFHC